MENGGELPLLCNIHKEMSGYYFWFDLDVMIDWFRWRALCYIEEIKVGQH